MQINFTAVSRAVVALLFVAWAFPTFSQPRNGQRVQRRAPRNQAARAAALRAPTQTTLRRQLRQLEREHRVEPELLRRLRNGLRHNDPEIRARLSEAINSERQAQQVRTRVNTHAPSEYVHTRRARRRRPTGSELPQRPKPPEQLGPFEDSVFQQYTPAERARVLGMKKDRNGLIERPHLSHQLPNMENVQRRTIYRKAPRYLGGMLSFFFPSRTAGQLTRKMDQLMTPTAEGSYKLHADKVTLLYPDLDVSPAGKPRYAETYREALSDAAFVFAQTYEFTNRENVELIDSIAANGVPVYAIVGEAKEGNPAREVWGSNRSKVNFVASHQENQGNGRQFRIDHNKNLFVVKRDGRVVVIRGGINQNEQSTKNVDMGHMLEGGNVGLDVLGPMIRDYLRAGGKLDPKDFEGIREPMKNMINYEKNRNSVTLETAITSSHIVRKGERMTRQQMVSNMRRHGVQYISGKSVLKELTVTGRGERTEAGVAELKQKMLAASERGKRLVVVFDSDMNADQRASLRNVTQDFAQTGIELVDEGTIYVDNSTENVMYRRMTDAARKGESIWRGAFANSDGNLNKHTIQVSKILKRVDPTQTVEVMASDLVIDGNSINAGNATRLLFSRNFHGTVSGLTNIPGPEDANGRPRKFHMKAMATYRPAKDGRSASGAYTLKSNNDSVTGHRVNEESSVTVYSAEHAKEMIDFMKKVKETHGKVLRPALKQSQVSLRERHSMTKRIVRRDTKLKEMVFIVMDYETSGLSFRTDARPTQIAARAYKLNAAGTKLVPVRVPSLPVEFNRFIHQGKDHFGRSQRLSTRVTEITRIHDDMLHYQSNIKSVMNDYNNWVRTIEKETGMTIMHVGHNFGFDRRMHNDFNSIEGVNGNPIMDGDTADTLRAAEKMLPRTKRKLFPAAIHMAGRSAMPEGEAHRADVDIKVNALLFENMLVKLSRGFSRRNTRGRTVRLTEELGNLGNVQWGQIRHVFLPKTQIREEQQAARQGEN